MDNPIDVVEQRDDMEDVVATSKQNDKNKTENIISEKKITAFQKLTPTHLDESQMAGYQEALNFAFAEDDLLNIALSGPYASGKTSIIKSYVDSTKKRVLYISLAYFETIGSDDNDANKSDKQADTKQKLRSASSQHARELMLERKIINQLIHQVKPDKIPNTEFRVKHEPNKRKVIDWTILITLLILFFSYFQKDWFQKIFDTSLVMLVFIFFTVLIVVGYLTYNLIEMQSRRSIIQRLKVFETELDISGTKKDESYFDKYLDEILYILERADVEAIIFEDIDRYEDNLILSKLRELNTIYNRKPKDKDKKIKFIYLIKDEMFESKDRAKFFDYIIPVVPVVDGGNSFSQINALFAKDNLADDFKDKAFLHDLSLFLDDMRLIKNIYNEYVIYRQKLVNETTKRWLDYTKLLAIITYKNLFPKDFEASRLGHGRGVLHRIIDSFAMIERDEKNNRISAVEKEIEELRKEIDLAEKEHLNSLAELMCVYIKLPARELWFPVSNSVRVSSAELTPVDVIKHLKENDYEYYYQGNVYDNSGNKCENSFKELENNENYTRRKAYLEQTKQEYLKLKHNQLQQKESKKIMPSAQKNIKELLDGVADRKRLFTQHFPINEKTTQYETISKEFDEIYSSPYFALLDYLLSGGYIDEDYNDYMSFFYEGGISANEKEFLRNVAKRQPSDRLLPLHHCDVLLSSRLQRTHFQHSYILNISLFDYLVTQQHQWLADVIAMLITNHQQTDFVDSYFTQQNNLLDTLQDKALEDQQVKLISFTTMLNRQWPLFWEKTGLDKKYYLYLSFRTIVDTTLAEMNEGERLTQFIDKQADFLHLEEKQMWAILKLDSLQSVFEQLVVSFQQISKAFEPIGELFDLVYTHNFYELSIANIDYILEHVHHLPSDHAKRLTSIYSLSDPAEPLYNYSDAHIDALIKMFVDSDIVEFKDNEDVVIQLLNNEAITADNKYAYLAKSTTVLKDLSAISNDKELWDTLLEHRLVSYSAQNITHYFFNYEVESDEDARTINEELVSFINSGQQIISGNEAGLKSFLNDNQIGKFFNAVIKSNDIENDRYEMLILWCYLYYSNFSYKEIDSDKVAILINRKVIKLTDKQNMEFLRAEYPDNVNEFLVKNIDEYIKRLAEHPELFMDDELRELLASDISEKQKLALIDFANEDISIQDLPLTECIRDRILEKHFDLTDMSYITSAEYYKPASDSHKEKIKQVCLEYFGDVLTLSSMAYDLLISLLRADGLEIDEKYQLLANILNKLSSQQAYECFCIVEEFLTPEQKEKREFSRVFKRKLPTFEYTDLNMKIAEKIESMNWGSISEKNEVGRTFRINGRSLVKED